MMANSHLGLMQLQHKSEDSVSVPFPDFVSVNEQNPLSATLSVNNSSSIPGHVSGNGNGGGPIKRKRGRPRKYTLGPFPAASSMKLSNSPNHDRSRLSLPSQFTNNGEAFSSPSATYSALPNSIHTNAVTDSLMKSVKHVKTKIGQKLNYSSMVPMPTTNGHSSIEEQSACVDQSKTTTTNSLNSLLTPQIDTHSSESNPSMSSSMFRYPVAPTVLSTPAIFENNVSTTKSYNYLQAHQNHSPASAYTSPRNSSLPTSCSTSLPYFIDPFFQQSAASASASMSAISSPTPSGTFEANLVGRVLPQAEAAICAAKAAGLSGPHTWTPEMVSAFIVTLPGCQGLAQVFIEHEIDGTALLCLEQHDLTTIMKLKLGPAVKIFGAIRVLRRTIMSIPYTDLSADHASALAAAITCFPLASTSSRLDKLSAKQQHVKNHHHYHTTTTNNNNHQQQQQQPGASAYLAKKLGNQVPSSSESPAGVPTGLDLTPNTASPYHASPASSPHVNGVENQSTKSID